MASPSELSLEEIRKYLLDNGGSARNQDLVKYFKKFLTDPESRVESRNRFKEYINTLATIKTEEGEKYLVLRKRFRQPTLDLSSPTLKFGGFNSSPIATPDISTPTSPLREPPPYRPPPIAPLSPIQNTSSPIRQYAQDPPIGLPVAEPIVEDNVSAIASRLSSVEERARSSPSASPPIPPRRKSQDKIKFTNKENQIIDRARNGSDSIKEDEQQQQQQQLLQTPPAQQLQPSATSQLTPAEQLSVRERMQKFNRMATETDLPVKLNASLSPSTKKRPEKGAEDDDRSSVASQQQLDSKSREWLVKAAQGDYQGLAKLAAEEPRLARMKDPCSGYTALHWAAKHGDENIIKLIAGTYKDYIKSVNETSNGGYTALHIATQFDHENIYNLLVKVYGANQDIRDYSGKKAHQYSISQKAAVSQDTMRKIKTRKKHAERDLGFLRIGSLNVRVKRTTEAFSQLMGKATNHPSNNSNDKIHKSWGSADNLPADKMMPPPKYAPIKKRRSRRATDFSSSSPLSPRSQPSTPTLPNRALSSKPSLSTTTASTLTQHRRPASVSAIPTNTLLIQAMSRSNKDNRPNGQQNDSDSDGACGFDSSWRGSA